jgi:Ligand-gated ion channel
VSTEALAKAALFRAHRTEAEGEQAKAASCKVSALATAQIITIVSQISPLGQFEVKRVLRVDEETPIQEYVMDSLNDSALIDNCAASLGQMPLPRSRSWAVRLLFLTYGFFCVIVLSSYTANLAGVGPPALKDGMTCLE